MEFYEFALQANIHALVGLNARHFPSVFDIICPGGTLSPSTENLWGSTPRGVIAWGVMSSLDRDNGQHAHHGNVSVGKDESRTYRTVAAGRSYSVCVCNKRANLAGRASVASLQAQ